MKRQIERLYKRIVNTIVLRTMPIILENYNSLYSERWHPHYALRQEALAETVEYIKANMSQAMIKHDEYEVLAHSSQNVTLNGLFLEFGVRTGQTINFISSLNPTKVIHGFDSFAGLPEAWTGWVQEKGTFSGEGIPQVNSNVRLVAGWFEDSLPKFLADQCGDLALAHIDSDLYTSAKTILTNLASRIKPGSIIVFNEYFNYPNWKAHEYRAFQEFCQEYAVEYEYLCWGKFEVAVKILAIEAGEEVGS